VTHRFRLGSAAVARVVQVRFSLDANSFPDTPLPDTPLPDTPLPDTPPPGWRDNADLLVPDFFDPGAIPISRRVAGQAREVDRYRARLPRPDDGVQWKKLLNGLIIS
jgi:hypothetical protein